MKKIAFLAALGLLFASLGSRFVAGQTGTLTIEIVVPSYTAKPNAFETFLSKIVKPELSPQGIDYSFKVIDRNEFEQYTSSARGCS